MKLTKHFKLEEFIRSETAKKGSIYNYPNKEQLENIKTLCENCLEPIRELLGFPMVITSGFRSKELNKKVGGVSSSQHLTGMAADFITINHMTDLHNSLCQSFDKIKSSGISFDQLILEPIGDIEKRWMHISYVSEEENRNEALE